METALDIAELVWRVAGALGVAAAIGFGGALWRHNRKVKAHNVDVRRHNEKAAYFEDVSRWCPGASMAIQRYLIRSEVGASREIDEDVFWRPPRVPHMATPYYAVSYADVSAGEVSADVHHEQYDLADPIEVFRAVLPSLGLADVLVDEQAFLARIWLMSPDEPSQRDAVLASTVTDPNQFRHFRLAVLYLEDCVVWVHRIDDQER